MLSLLQSTVQFQKTVVVPSPARTIIQPRSTRCRQSPVHPCPSSDNSSSPTHAYHYESGARTKGFSKRNASPQFSRCPNVETIPTMKQSSLSCDDERPAAESSNVVAVIVAVDTVLLTRLALLCAHSSLSGGHCEYERWLHFVE
jgi:hypothetical protein